MKIIVTDDRIEIYREDMEETHGQSCREHAEWCMTWAIGRLSQSIAKSIHKPGSGDSVLCD